MDLCGFPAAEWGWSQQPGPISRFVEKTWVVEETSSKILQLLVSTLMGFNRFDVFNSLLKRTS